MMHRQAQTSLEYAVLVSAVVAALVGMTIYMKRGMQGRLQQSAENIGQQYDPAKTTGNMTMTSRGHTITRVTSNAAGGKIETTSNTIIEEDSSTVHGSETVLP